MHSIKEFYRGEEIFVTGATGFIGKALVEKILRTCSGVKTVYLLMRPKKGQSTQNRIKVLTDNIYFSKLKAEQPDAINKLKVIEGDSKEVRLGMSDSDFEKVRSCSMIFHLAASVRFDDHLKDAILLNTRGAREVCEIAKTMPNLKIFVHVSTAYVQPLNLNVVEELIDIDCNWRDYIKMAENLQSETLDTLTMKLTKHAPNTYTFTKLLAEHVCNDYRNEYDLPIVIYRPSIVGWSDYEVQTGWSESLNGPNGIFVAYFSGVKRVQIGSLDIEVIPVDICVKGMIIASAKHCKGTERKKAIPVYNAAAVHLIAHEMLVQVSDSLHDHLFNKAIGLPSLIYTDCRYYAGIMIVLQQLIPAVLIDTLLILMKRKPMIMKLQRIIRHSEVALDYFINHDFNFEKEKFNLLGTNLHEDDKHDFYMWPRTEKFEYMRQAHIVSKEIILNETAECAARAKKRTPYYKALTLALKSFNCYLAYNAGIFVYKLAAKHFDNFNL